MFEKNLFKNLKITATLSIYCKLMVYGELRHNNLNLSHI